ncbi:MAG TPA: PHP-associated domain-containing protein, partial [Methylococcales bacterium]
SPCAADEMTPPEIVARALEARLAVIAICDHNSTGNVAAVQAAAGGRLCVFAGIEMMTAEEIHILGIFPDANTAETVGLKVGKNLPMGGRRYFKEFGTQLVLDAGGRTIGKEERMLAASSGYSLTEAVRLIHEHGGLAIAAHINRPSFSIFSQLGIFPDNAGFDAVELFCPPQAKLDVEMYAFLELPMVVSSDSHYPADVGRCRTMFKMASACFEEFAKAIKGIDGRGVGSIST